MIKALKLVIMFSVSNDSELPVTWLAVLRCGLEGAVCVSALHCGVQLAVWRR